MDRITSLPDGHIFVFGSNEAGIHGAGAAKDAVDFFGAQWGLSNGLVGPQAYAIPTKNHKIKTLGAWKINEYIKDFNLFVKAHPELIFHVTPIGTGLAGYEVVDIVHLFIWYTWPANVIWPPEFSPWLHQFIMDKPMELPKKPWWRIW